MGQDPPSLTATHVINSLSCHQSGDLTTSTADGRPSRKTGGHALSLHPTQSAHGRSKRGHNYREAPYPTLDLLWIHLWMES